MWPLTRYVACCLILFLCIEASGSVNRHPSVSGLQAHCLKDSLKKDSVQHSPKKAALLSALLPGAGQAYNRKYWKIPVIYVVGGTGGYFIQTNISEYKRFRMAYIYRTDDDPDTNDEFPQATATQLKVYRDYYRRNTELSVIFTTVFYLLQILDATVDAHLYDFDVSNNLAVSLQPRLFNTGRSPGDFAMGLTVHLSFGPNKQPYAFNSHHRIRQDGQAD